LPATGLTCQSIFVINVCARKIEFNRFKRWPQRAAHPA
jgi:hypothetical protein